MYKNRGGQIYKNTKDKDRQKRTGIEGVHVSWGSVFKGYRIQVFRLWFSGQRFASRLAVAVQFPAFVVQERYACHPTWSSKSRVATWVVFWV